jgi:hypothetical protein
LGGTSPGALWDDPNRTGKQRGIFDSNKEKTIDWLEKGIEVGDPNMPYMGVMPFFVDLLGDEPRYQGLLQRMNLPAGK